MKRIIDSKKITSIIGVILIAVFFIVISLIVQKNYFGINDYLSRGYLGMLIYVLIVIIAIVIAPISATPLLPIASNMWGWFYAGLLSIFGWTIGAVIAFLLARKYGTWFISRWINLNKLYKLEKNIPEDNLFISVVFLRMALPVDLLSYALGLFSKMSLKSYFFATLIGVMPFAFILAYLGSVNIIIQIASFFIGAIIFLVGWQIASKKKRI